MRLIDADELKIDFGFTWDDIAPTREEMFEIIDRQPSAEPRWIPCSERLPDEDGYYLVTNSKWGAPWREITLWMTDGWSSDNKPIAWMPLPEPWKGEEDGRSN